MYWANGTLFEGTINPTIAYSEVGWIYEVLRLHDKKPAFLDRHLNRLENSLKMIQLNCPFSREELFQAVVEIAKYSDNVYGNIRIDIEKNGARTQIGLISHKYPQESEYQNGVEVVSAYFERENPNLKVWNQNLRETTDDLKSSQKVYEILLLNNDQMIHEGSRSNIFLVKSNELYTAPDAFVLPGITREIVIEIAEELNILVHKWLIRLSDLKDFDAAFLTGTSPGILPVRKMDHFVFDVANPLIYKLSKAYHEKIQF